MSRAHGATAERQRIGQQWNRGSSVSKQHVSNKYNYYNNESLVKITLQSHLVPMCAN